MLFRAYADSGAPTRSHGHGRGLGANHTPRLGGLDPHSLTSSPSDEQAISTPPPTSSNWLPLLVPAPSRFFSASIVVDGFCKSGHVTYALHLLDEMTSLMRCAITRCSIHTR
uniref:Pentatricopeptide repeat-containing protein n=2 Tax=Oryza TaxID=4527 RepID=A0A0D3H4E0_9ORYZ